MVYDDGPNHIKEDLCITKFLQAKLSVVAAERDSAVREMRQMAEQCQRVAGEFDAMAQHCDLLERDNKRVGLLWELSTVEPFRTL